jgi:hypothetical protein
MKSSVEAHHNEGEHRHHLHAYFNSIDINDGDGAW